MKSIVEESSPVRATPDAAFSASRPAWWKRLRGWFLAMDYMMARHQRLGWSADLDQEALRRRLEKMGPRKPEAEERNSARGQMRWPQ